MLGQSHMLAGSPGPPFLQSARRCHVGAFAAHAKGSGTCQKDEFLSMGLPELVADSLSRPRAPRTALAQDFALAYLKQEKELLLRTAELGALCKEMQSLTMRYLTTQNRLSVRGVLEYAEEAVVLPHSSNNGLGGIPLRQRSWQQILRERPCLVESIQEATGWRPEWIPNRIEYIYMLLHEHERPAVLEGYDPMLYEDRLIILEGSPLSREHMRAVECICHSFHVVYSLRYRTALPALENRSLEHMFELQDSHVGLELE